MATLHQTNSDVDQADLEKHTEHTGDFAKGEEDLHVIAQRGHAATDKYGRVLVHFDPAVEARIRRKIDWAICPVVAPLYLFCFIDRNNIGNARLAGLERDLALRGFQFNEILTIFFISYILFEVPSNMACKYFGPGKWLPFCTLMFGIMSISFGFVHTYNEAMAVRFLLGLFEAGMLPGIAYYMSRWYRKAELAFRLALYVVTAPLAGAIGGLLASGILKSPNFGSVTAWRKIFVIEGIITCGLGIVAYFILTDRPATAKWLTQEEKDIAIARVKSEHVGTTVVLDRIDKAKIKAGMLNPNTLGVSWIFLLNNITAGGVAIFAPTIVATIYPTYSTVHQQLMTVPPYVLGAAGVLFFCYTSWKIDKRMIYLIGLTVPVMIGYIMLLATNARDPSQAKIRYGGVFVLTLGLFSYGALTNAQVAVNTVTDTARSAAIGTNVMISAIGGLISTWSYIKTDGPQYNVGNGLNLASAVAIAVSGSALMFWESRDNKRRAKVDVDSALEGLTEDQIADLDWRHPSFRWKY
ncbi:MFS general substrate transporter [Cystobasidium minutum MCA 4210]|uniref:MFS general substrate transporter n=1 Tax=Cystobasidium minutum MCA 4210 TaxID=1397322 RepID=UPI0034CDE7BB|eukprot:jgi/Rhomi1/83733/CE83732_385